MKKNIAYTLLALALIITTATSCRKDREIGGTSVEAMSGDWWVQIDGEGSYYTYYTYNTSANSKTEMILDDQEGFWGSASLGRVAGKVNVDLNTLTFSCKDAPNLNKDYDDASFTVTDGKILKNAATAPGTGIKTDSIDFKIEFADDPGTVYHLKGYKRTRFTEDDH
ncbi:MAG: lipid-binding protein [Mucilaginibacter sp.]|uniref:lipid-binding protein n=1 Tax=Mucilaginibacter sp. TaxID=1882438 RepID=UPI00319EF182